MSGIASLKRRPVSKFRKTRGDETMIEVTNESRKVNLHYASQKLVFTHGKNVFTVSNMGVLSFNGSEITDQSFPMNGTAEKITYEITQEQRASFVYDYNVIMNANVTVAFALTESELGVQCIIKTDETENYVFFSTSTSDASLPPSVTIDKYVSIEYSPEDKTSFEISISQTKAIMFVYAKTSVIQLVCNAGTRQPTVLDITNESIEPEDVSDIVPITPVVPSTVAATMTWRDAVRKLWTRGFDLKDPDHPMDKVRRKRIDHVVNYIVSELPVKGSAELNPIQQAMFKEVCNTIDASYVPMSFPLLIADVNLAKTIFERIIDGSIVEQPDLAGDQQEELLIMVMIAVLYNGSNVREPRTIETFRVLCNAVKRIRQHMTKYHRRHLSYKTMYALFDESNNFFPSLLEHQTSDTERYFIHVLDSLWSCKVPRTSADVKKMMDDAFDQTDEEVADESRVTFMTKKLSLFHVYIDKFTPEDKKLSWVDEAKLEMIQAKNSVDPLVLIGGITAVTGILGAIYLMIRKRCQNHFM